MTPVDVIACSSAAVCALTTVAGVIYSRGKLDAHSRAISETLAKVEVRLEALQTERTTLVKDTAVLETRQSSHERECVSRQQAIEKRFDGLDTSLREIFAQLRNLALGVAPQGEVATVEATTRRARR